MILLLLLSSLVGVLMAQDQIADNTPSLILFTVNDCSDCDQAKVAWNQLAKVEPEGVKLVEVCAFILEFWCAL